MEVASSNPVTVPCFFSFMFLFYICIYLQIQSFECNSLSFPNHLMTTNNAYPTELMHSVSSRICLFVFDNAPFDGHFV